MPSVELPPADLAAYEAVLGGERLGVLRELAEAARDRLGGARVWNVNSTAAGGGVAELLRSLVPLARALGVDVRWEVIEGDAEFFAITKRLCTRLYGAPGDDGALGGAERAHVREVSARDAERLAQMVAPGDVVVVHESQPAPLLEQLRVTGATLVWRRHIGCDVENDWTRQGWSFLRPFVEQADATVFLTAAHTPDWAPRPTVIPPSIDPTSVKNVPLSEHDVLAVLRASGLLHGGPGEPVTVRPVGQPAVRVSRPALVVREGPAPDASTPMVVQVSRWDELKDMAGVMAAFARCRDERAHLVLAGADVVGVADDPDAAVFFERCRTAWEELPADVRRRVHLVCLPMEDLRENALVVNALQRHATVVVQKSLAEGFGLTVSEAMFKARPVVAAAVGGIRDQIQDGSTGLLVTDPHDLDGVAAAVDRLLADPALADRLGAAARVRVEAEYLTDVHLARWLRVLSEQLQPEGVR